MGTALFMSGERRNSKLLVPSQGSGGGFTTLTLGICSPSPPEQVGAPGAVGSSGFSAGGGWWTLSPASAPWRLQDRDPGGTGMGQEATGKKSQREAERTSSPWKAGLGHGPGAGGPSTMRPATRSSWRCSEPPAVRGAQTCRQPQPSCRCAHRHLGSVTARRGTDSPAHRLLHGSPPSPGVALQMAVDAPAVIPLSGQLIPVIE